MEEIFPLGLLVHFNFCETKFVCNHPFVVSFGWLASQWGYLLQGARANMIWKCILKFLSQLAPEEQNSKSMSNQDLGTTATVRVIEESDQTFAWALCSTTSLFMYIYFVLDIIYIYSSHIWSSGSQHHACGLLNSYALSAQELSWVPSALAWAASRKHISLQIILPVKCQMEMALQLICGTRETATTSGPFSTPTVSRHRLL
jgi:hypothetical protein